MIKLFKPLSIVALIALALGCSEDDPLPRATVDFTNKIAEVGVEVTFENLSLNADRYEWRFGTSQTSTEISPKVTFNTPGAIEVVLRAFTKDGQIDSLVRTVTIRQRYLTAYAVNVYPTKNNGVDWDAGEPAANVFPDIAVQFIINKPQSQLTQADFDNSLFDLFTDVDISSFFVEISDQDVIMTNNTNGWSFSLFDFDDNDPNISTDDDFEFMTGVAFNPVTAPTVKSPNGEIGRISIFVPEEDGIPALGLDIFFELR